MRIKGNMLLVNAAAAWNIGDKNKKQIEQESERAENLRILGSFFMTQLRNAVS